MASDPAFSDMIRKWTAADTQIRNLNNQLRDLRSARETLTTSVCEYMKTKGLDKRKIEISDSTLSYCEKTETSSLSYSYLEKRLGDIIPDKDQVEYIITYLKEKRETKKVPDLRRVYRNDTKESSAE
jgi:hypothetical protein